MGRKRKVDLIKIQGLKDSGLCLTDIAKKMAVSKSAVSKGFKKLGLCSTQDVVLRTATQISDSKINAMSKLEHIVDVVEKELDCIQDDLKNTKGKDRIVWQEIQLKHTAEIRKQLSLLLEISQTLYRIEEIDAFKKIVLEVIGEESPELRDRIFEQLRKRRNQSNLNMGGSDL